MSHDVIINIINEGYRKELETEEKVVGVPVPKSQFHKSGYSP